MIPMIPILNMSHSVTGKLVKLVGYNSVLNKNH